MSKKYVDGTEKIMKIISIAAVTAGGKTTVVNKLKEKLDNVCTLHFDDYTFEGEVDDFYQWVLDGADYNVWNLKPLEKDIIKIMESGKYEYLILDYPFAYCNEQIKKYIDTAIFIDTPLDVALARRILRDMAEASGNEIRNDLELYLKYARIAFIQMQKDVLPSSDYVVDGLMGVNDVVGKIVEIFNSGKVDFNMIKEVQQNELSECVKVIRESFKTVADELGFTAENAPRFTAFATTEERLNWHLNGEHRSMYAYYVHGMIVGYYSLLLQENQECELNNVCVLSTYRHKGIGKELLKHAFRVAEELGCRKMNIGIVEENVVLRKWYEAYGFVHTGTQKFDFFPFTCGYMEKVFY